MKYKYICAGLLITVAAAACGTSGSDTRDVSGTWTGTLNLDENTCNLPGLPATVAFTHNVDQNEDAVTLQDGATQYLGNTVCDDGFSVDATGLSDTLSDGTVCTFDSGIEYHDIDADSDNTADVVFTNTGPCTGSSSCTVRYTGGAVRD